VHGVKDVGAQAHGALPFKWLRMVGRQPVAVYGCFDGGEDRSLNAAHDKQLLRVRLGTN